MQPTIRFVRCSNGYGDEVQKIISNVLSYDLANNPD